jgi:hypothetical protein
MAIPSVANMDILSIGEQLVDLLDLIGVTWRVEQLCVAHLIGASLRCTCRST